MTPDRALANLRLHSDTLRALELDTEACRVHQRLLMIRARKAGATVTAVAEAAGLDRTHVSRILRGDRS